MAEPLTREAFARSRAAAGRVARRDGRVLAAFSVALPPIAVRRSGISCRSGLCGGCIHGCLSEEMFDLVVEQTQKSGDLRVGIDLLKRAALNAERRANRSVDREDICRAYDVSKYLHLSFSVKSLKDEEKIVLRTLAAQNIEDAEMNAVEVYKAIKAVMPIGYTRFYEIVKKFDAMRLINLQYRDGKGRTRVITLRYDPAKIIEYMGAG